MNITFVLPFYHTNLYAAFNALSDAGHQIHLICATDRDNVSKAVSTYTVIDPNSITLRKSHQMLRQLNPDLLIIRKTNPLSKLMYQASLLQRRRVISYDLRPYMHPRHFGKVLHGMLNSRPSRRLTPVHGLPEHGRPDPRATYLPFPVDTMPDNLTRDYAPNRVIRILCVAKLAQRRKNHFLLLNALKPLAKQFDFRVTFVGSSSLDTRYPDPETYEALHRYAIKGELADRVIIKPDIPFHDMPSIYRANDICVLPSSKEPLGIAPLEAMAQGCAAIVSSDAGSAYYIVSGQNAGLPCGAIFQSGNEVSLRDQLTEIMSSPEKLRTLGRNAAEWTRREFSPDVFVKRFNSLLSSI